MLICLCMFSSESLLEINHFLYNCIIHSNVFLSSYKKKLVNLVVAVFNYDFLKV